MNTIIQFKSKPVATVNALEAEKQKLLVHLKRLARAGETLVQATGYGLADQVLTHALVTTGMAFDLLPTSEGRRLERASVRAITHERYALSLNAGRDCSDDMVLEARDLLKGWPQDGLVQYVLDHEVPVDPVDMPGAASLLRFAS